MFIVCAMCMLYIFMDAFISSIDIGVGIGIDIGVADLILIIGDIGCEAVSPETILLCIPVLLWYCCMIKIIKLSDCERDRLV